MGERAEGRESAAVFPFLSVENVDPQAVWAG